MCLRRERVRAQFVNPRSVGAPALTDAFAQTPYVADDLGLFHAQRRQQLGEVERHRIHRTDGPALVRPSRAEHADGARSS